MLSRRNDTNWSLVGEMRVGEMTQLVLSRRNENTQNDINWSLVSKMRIGKMRVGEIRVGKMRVGEIRVGKMSLNHIWQALSKQPPSCLLRAVMLSRKVWP